MNHAQRYAKQYKMDRTRGLGPRYRDAGPARQRIIDLRAAGHTDRAIAGATGLAHSIIRKIADGRTRHLHARTADAIANVTTARLLAQDGRYVPAVGARRRVRALLAIGWRYSDLAPWLGTTAANLCNHPGQLIRSERHTAACAAYDALSLTPGPSELNRRRAATLGWAPPLAWDDDTIDEPNASPNYGQPQRRARVHVEDVEFLADEGGTWESIATRLNVQRASVRVALQRAGQHGIDLAARLDRREQGRAA